MNEIQIKPVRERTKDSGTSNKAVHSFGTIDLNESSHIPCKDLKNIDKFGRTN